MLTFQRRSGIRIPREYENEEFYIRIKEKLHRRVQNFQGTDFTINKFYSEGDKSFIIPRYFPIHEYIDCQIEDVSHKGADIDIKHHIKPRNETQKKAINHMMENDKGIIKLNPGMGKTVITIYMISERKKKSIILVHRDSLVAQWKERFMEFTNLKDDDIANLRSTSFEKDLDKPVIISTTQTFISLLKRKRKEFLIKLNEANIGIFISDEAHTTVAAPTFAECAIQLPTSINFALTATPERHDGNHDIIEYHTGKIFRIEDDSGTMKANVTVLLVNYGIDTPQRHQYLYWEGRFQRARYLNLIKNSKLFMALSKYLLDKFYIDERNLLYICERIKLIDELFSWCGELYPSISKFISGSTNDELKEQMVFTTPGKCRDGVDIPEKDCLIMTSPVSNVTQLCGRVTRGQEGKKTPIVVDIVDIGCTRIAKTLYDRINYYHKKGWTTQFVLCSPSGEKQILTKEDAYVLLNNL